MNKQEALPLKLSLILKGSLNVSEKCVNCNNGKEICTSILIVFDAQCHLEPKQATLSSCNIVKLKSILK